MALAFPPGLFDRIAGISTVRWLLLLAVWGIAVFLWGTFGAWTDKRGQDAERLLVQPYASRVATWLTQQADILDSLHSDARLAEGIQLPAGVESLPVQRVLYEFAYLNRIADVYALDLLQGKSGRTAGAVSLPPHILKRFDSLSDRADVMLMGIGLDNAKMLILRRINAPLPQRLYAAVPLNLGMLATAVPKPPVTFQERTAHLIFAHTDGWARWDMASPALELATDADNIMQSGGILQISNGSRQITYMPLDGLPGVALEVEGPRAITSTALLPRLMVLIWAIAMSLMILWHEPRFRTLVGKATAPVKPLMSAVPPLAARLKGLGTLLPVDMIAKAWQDARGLTPLVDGPGELDARAFRTSPRRALSSSPARKKSLSAPTLVEPAAGSGKALPKIERRTRSRGSRLQANDARPHATNAKPVWVPPADKAKPKPDEAAKKDPSQPEIDEDNLLEVIKDCLRQKRIKLLYQPMYRASDNMPVIHEVFARLVRRDGTLLSPGEFLPVVLKNRLSLELDIAVLRKVVYEHFSQGREPMTSLAVNISSNSLDGIAYLQEMTSQGPRVLRRMGFEVSSQEMIRDPKALKLLKDLQKHGGNIAVDYFGGGEAMLDASKSLGFNYVKLDATRFVDTDEGKKHVIKLCQYANSIGLPIILEKISHRDVEEFGRRAGAHYLQGFALKSPQEMLTLTQLQT
ncbi:MAG: EAL domain-containing protein [Blastochloris viridis]|uniref:EAL domain-containing protein n=1 Tax=Blastochloris viridis TaxID=1079 RepID=A0A6N4R4Z7_BLAVI|nr:MAG: EAL domain-containing protein [Blastochloris viridis]